MITTVQGSLLPSVRIDQFFDRRGQMAGIQRKKFKYLRRAGGTIRLIAKRSIRKRKAISTPGTPPSSHEGSLRKSIFYGLDKMNESAVIGPSAAWRQADSGGTLRGASLLEFGGVTWGPAMWIPGEKKKDNWIRIPAGPRTYRPRPFMDPALDEAEPRLAKMFADA
ncbi:hypothetical protein [Rubinisphaera italica]|uniref:Phage virion morphogenesis family protein n=1 Tax=Rubinisphaera italica TaxID=2527969 RepID=A0A5C5XLB0_9PLAN|nr:hypothetical protein [Rubinisphaera italica]TWT63193.1 hypothetical protein Pan54_39460 [Rubinisphaera italica]